jgi:transcriptional regulator with XRE-family HTH domain
MKYQKARIMLCQYLYAVAKEKGITHDKIAESTGFSRSNISRMLSGKYPPSLDNFLKLADAIGVYFFIIDKDDDNAELVEMMKNRWGKTEPN